MDRIILSSGKMQLGDCQVDMHIYYNFGDGVRPHYSFDINPQVRDEHQLTFHIGETMMAFSLENLISQMEVYKSEFHHIVELRDNDMFEKLHID